MNAKKINKIATLVINTMTFMVMILLLSMFLFVIFNGLPELNLKFITSPSKSFEAGGGIGIQLFNSFYLLILSMIISLPISLGSAIFLNEYVSKRNKFVEMLEIFIEVLSSLPSVVIGLFGFLVFVTKFHMGFSVFSGAIALTFLNIPLLTRSFQNSLSSITNLQRQAGQALGLSKWETIWHLIIPEAIPGMVTAIILASGRVFGEAAILIYTAGQSSPNPDWGDFNPFNITSFLSPIRPAETLAVHIWKVNSEGTVPDASQVSAGASAVLIIVVLIFNLTARFVGKKIHNKLTAN